MDDMLIKKAMDGLYGSPSLAYFCFFFLFHLRLAFILLSLSHSHLFLFNLTLHSFSLKLFANLSTSGVFVKSSQAASSCVLIRLVRPSQNLNKNKCC